MSHELKPIGDLIPGILNPPKTLADVDPGVRSVLEEAVADYRSSQTGVEPEERDRRIKIGVDAVWALVAKCESPIEKLIVPSLVFQPYGSNGPWIPAQAMQQGDALFAPVGIQAQAEAPGARFDFLMFLEVGGEALLVAVECDGKEFHSADRDFYRDRMWKGDGLHTVRLSGSDIRRAPRMAASRVAEFVLQQMIKKGLA